MAPQPPVAPQVPHAPHPPQPAPAAPHHPQAPPPVPAAGGQVAPGWQPPSAPGAQPEQPARSYPYAAPAASDSQPGRRIAEPVRPTRRSGEAASVETPRRPSAPAPEFDPSLTSPAVEPWQLPTGDEAAWTPVFDAPEPEEAPPPKRRRLRPLTLILGGVAIVVLALVAYQFLGRNSNPDPEVLVTDANPSASGARVTNQSDLVKKYFSALSAGDAEQAQTYGPVGPGSKVALTSQSLKDSLDRLPLTDVDVEDVDATATEVPVKYRLGGSPVSTKVDVRKQNDGGYLLEQSTVTVPVTAKRSTKIPVLVNGEKFNAGSLEVFPGSYLLTTGLPFLEYQGNELQVTTLDAAPEVNLLTVALTKQGQDALVKTGRASLETCVKSTSLAPTGCPFATSAKNPIVPGSVRWSLDGDPWANVTPRLSTQREVAEVVIDLKMLISVKYQNGTSNQDSIGFEGPVTLRVDMSRTTEDELEATWAR